MSATDLQDNIAKKIFLKGKIVVESGLHIGGSDSSLDIGGERNPVIRIKKDDSNQPYIPGSSVKGKIRSLLEHLRGEFGQRGRDLVEAQDEKHPTARIYGTGAGDDTFSRASRVIFRDALLSENSVSKNPTELKTENSISRITSKANPRPFERVLPETEFDLEIVFDIYKNDLISNPTEQKDDFTNDGQRIVGYTLIGMDLLENDYLGGGGSRGSGKIEFKIDRFEVKTAEDYLHFNKKTEVKNEYMRPQSMEDFQMLAKQLGL